MFTFLHLSSSNLVENDHNLMFFDYFVSTQQHFESRLFWTNAEKLRKHAQLKSYVSKHAGHMNFCSKFLCWTSHFTVFTIKEVQFTLFLYGLCFYLVNFQKFMHYLLCKSSPLSRRNCEKEFVLRLDCRIAHILGAGHIQCKNLWISFVFQF